MEAKHILKLFCRLSSSNSHTQAHISKISIGIFSMIQFFRATHYQLAHSKQFSRSSKRHCTECSFSSYEVPNYLNAFGNVYRSKSQNSNLAFFYTLVEWVKALLSIYRNTLFHAPTHRRRWFMRECAQTARRGGISMRTLYIHSALSYRLLNRALDFIHRQKRKRRLIFVTSMRCVYF